jgi:hypothetical protein
MTTRSQVEKLRRSADQAARVAKENRRLDYALEDIEIDLRYAVEKARGKLRALDFAGLQVEEELATLLAGLLDESERRYQRIEQRDDPC